MSQMISETYEFFLHPMNWSMMSSDKTVVRSDDLVISDMVAFQLGGPGRPGSAGQAAHGRRGRSGLAGPRVQQQQPEEAGREQRGGAPHGMHVLCRLVFYVSCARQPGTTS